MKDKTIDFELPSASPEEISRECHMSPELFQNARQTMGELRDFIRTSGLSWDFISRQVKKAETPPSPIEKALRKMDEYSTGPGRSLHDKSSNLKRTT